MKKNQWMEFLLCGIMMLVIFSGCAVVGGIFKAGVWTGVFIVAIIVGLIVWLVAKAGKK
jgi:hypothetical protein